MTAGHTFIDREGKVVRGREAMTKAWTDFFAAFPGYRNTFERVESHGGLVVLQGYATWALGGEPDHVLWTASIEDGRVAEWRIYADTPENRATLDFG
jgi:predicted SnoaL-like aldol condensation-catalyzing enzyme